VHLLARRAYYCVARLGSITPLRSFHTRPFLWH